MSGGYAREADLVRHLRSPAQRSAADAAAYVRAHVLATRDGHLYRQAWHLGYAIGVREKRVLGGYTLPPEVVVAIARWPLERQDGFWAGRREGRGDAARLPRRYPPVPPPRESPPPVMLRIPRTPGRRSFA